MEWIEIAFYILLGLLFTGFASIPYHELIVGILALIIGLVMLFNKVEQWLKTRSK